MKKINNIKIDCDKNKVCVKSVTLFGGDPKATLSIAITLKCTEGCFSSPWIAPFYH